MSNTTQEFINAITATPEEDQPPGAPRYKRIWGGIKKFLTVFPKWFGLYLGLAGLFTFNCFILQEAFQTVMFSTWGTFEARDYRLVKRQIDTMEGIRTTLKVVNNTGNWVNPFAWVAYQGYVDAAREYIDGTKAQVFAMAPELFEGEQITFVFRHLEAEHADGYAYYRNGIVTVMAMKESSHYTGLVTVAADGKVIIDARN